MFVAYATCAPMWKVFCSGTPLFRGRADPIISPGVVSNHLHKVAGASNFGPATTSQTPLQVYNTLRASTCTTCSLKTVDNSAYWHPDLFYQWPNGTLSLVPTGGLTAYYNFRGGDGAQTNPAWQAFPPGFRMVSGDPFKRSWNASSVAQQAVSFVCLASGPVPQSNNLTLTKYNYCVNGLRLQVNFPECWDGVNLDSPTHNTHVVFPTAPDGGDCPSSHPVRLPNLFFEAFYSVSAFPHGDGTRQPFVLACGDPTGFGFHGDFLNGWDQTLMQKAINDSTCSSTNTNDGNDVTNCATLAPYVQQTPAGACVIAHDIPLNENFNLGYPSPTLPGCDAITAGPAEATPCSTTGTGVTYVAPVTSRFFIKSVYTGRYLRAPPTTTQLIYSNSTAQTYWECWEAIPMGGGNVALLNDVTMQYTSADTGSASAITSSRGSASTWETFTIVSQPNNEVAIISLRNNQYLTVQPDFSVGPTSTTIGTLQLFQLVAPSGGTIS